MTQKREHEAIREAGSIQPHGFVLALHDNKVVQASDNLGILAGRAPEAVLGGPLAAAIGDAAAVLGPALAGDLRDRPTYLASVTLDDARVFDVLAHKYDQLILLEFEEATGAGSSGFHQIFPLVGDFLNRLGDADSVRAMTQVAVEEIRKLTGFGRVMVYRFEENGDGHVLAESREDAYPSFMDQRFPASGIVPEGELHAGNLIRLVRDANHVPSRLVPPENPVTGKPNAPGFAALRSCSPRHLQFMRSMDAMASMSIALMVKGSLWGLIACHHHTPCHVAFDKRSACEQLGQILALRIGSREDAQDLQFRLEARRSMVGVLAGLTREGDVLDNMQGVFPQLLRFVQADGVAILAHGRCACFGATPGEQEIRALAEWLEQSNHRELFHTDRLPALYLPARGFADIASGLLAIAVSRLHKHYLLWFRSERVLSVEWAGNRDSTPEDGAGQAPSARAGSGARRETVRATSRPWHPGELEMAQEFRSALLGIVLERAEQMAELAEELGRANKELEAFSYSVSHDLRAPLRHIVGFSDLLLESPASPDVDRRVRFLTNIKESARLAGKLVDDLLSFSQMGRAALRPISVDMGELVAGCIERMAPDLNGRHIEWQIGELPVVQADPAFLQLVVYNLLSNAVKFTGQRESAKIIISAEQNDTEYVFHVADNGVGFSMDYVHKLFGVFQRLHRMEEFQGTGIGLANVRRIVERHGGTVRASGSPGQGATFTFTIPKQLPSQGNHAQTDPAGRR